MSDYHILTQSKDLKTIDVVFHILIPVTGNNQAGKQWREAVVLEQGGAGNIVSVLPGISGAEDTALKAGEIIEVQARVRFSSVGLSNTEREAEIVDEYNRLKSEIVAEKQVTLAFLGHEGTVV